MHAETLREVARSNYRLQDIQFSAVALWAAAAKFFDIVWDDPPTLAERLLRLIAPGIVDRE